MSKLNCYILPRIGKLKVKDITKLDIIAIIDHIAIERNAPVQADRTKALLVLDFQLGPGRSLR